MTGKTRDEIVAHIEEQLGLASEDLGEEGIILFDGQEDAFLGVAERFEPIRVRTVVVTTTVDENGVIMGETREEGEAEEGGEHRYFAVYSYDKMVEALIADGTDHEEAVEYLEFNTVGLYAGPNTPAIMRDAR